MKRRDDGNRSMLGGSKLRGRYNMWAVGLERLFSPDGRGGSQPPPVFLGSCNQPTIFRVRHCSKAAGGGGGSGDSGAEHAQTENRQNQERKCLTSPGFVFRFLNNPSPSYF